MRRFFFPFLLLIFISCQQNTKVPVPVDDWAIFDSTASKPLNTSLRDKLEGVYAFDDSTFFGPLAACKWSYTITDNDTLYHFSMFCEEDISYFVCEGKKLNDKILLKGFWRKMGNDETGKARFVVNEKNATGKNEIVLEGNYGENEGQPDKKIRLQWLRPLNKQTHLEIVAHRGGGRVTDFIPSTENSIELILKAARFGATGVEIDVQLTKDGIPVLFHDANVNDRLTKKPGLHAPISDYTYEELITKYQLKKGEEIPKLVDALDSIVRRTPLEFVWLDTKDVDVLPKLRELQKKFLELANGMGRKIEFLIGIHDEKLVERLKKFDNYQEIPTICELDPEVVIQLNSRIWASIWTKGMKDEEVALIHSHKKRAFVWTIDKAAQIREFLYNGKFDGMVTNHPSCVAYYFYTRQ